jgi:hypothetical protein
MKARTDAVAIPRPQCSRPIQYPISRLVVAPTHDPAHYLAVDDERPSDRRAIVAELRLVRNEGVPVPGRERRHLCSDGIRLMLEQDREVLERGRAQREVHRRRSYGRIARCAPPIAAPPR